MTTTMSRRRQLPRPAPTLLMGLLHASLLATTTTTTSAFGPAPSFGAETARRTAEAPRPLRMSYYDMSDYGKADYEKEDEGGAAADKALYQASLSEGGGDGEVKLELPPPLSKNAGNAFVATIFDSSIDCKGGGKRDWEDLMDDRVELTGDHVRWCREANLYSDTFNAGGKVDVRKSYQILSSCATRPIGHILILESTDLSHVKSFLATDPIVQDLGCDVEDIPIYRWRHIKDYSLRIDDGRDGCPNVLLQMDRPAEELGGGDLRSEVEEDKLEYLIRSRRVIAAGPIHLPTSVKDDPSSLPVGDLIFFNAEDRDDAVAFAENDPASQAGLYGDMRVYKYNNLDVTGKFVSKNLHTMGSSDGYYNRNLRMKDEMKEEGYPVDDSQTPWFNY